MALAGVIPGCTWVFTPKKTHSKVPHKGDFRKNFTPTNFKKWWVTQLLPSLKQPSLIVLDSSKYHVFRPSSALNPTRMRRDAVIAALRANGLPAYHDETTNVLRSRLRVWVRDNVKPELMQLAEAHGHRVAFLPPGYPDLNPVEHVSSFVKGMVGHQYTPNTTFEEVHHRISAAFEMLTCSPAQVSAVTKTRVQAMIDATDNVVEQQYALAMGDADGVVLDEDSRGRAFDTWVEEDEDGADAWVSFPTGGDDDDDDDDDDDHNDADDSFAPY